MLVAVEKVIVMGFGLVEPDTAPAEDTEGLVKLAAFAGAATPASTNTEARSVAPSALKSFVIPTV